MVKITYDEDNKKMVQMIEDYYYFKDVAKVIYSDWYNFFETNGNNDKTLEIIYKHLSVYEFELIKNIAIKYIYKGKYKPSNLELLEELLLPIGKNKLIHRLKYILILASRGYTIYFFNKN